MTKRALRHGAARGHGGSGGFGLASDGLTSALGPLIRRSCAAEPLLGGTEIGVWEPAPKPHAHNAGANGRLKPAAVPGAAVAGPAAAPHRGARAFRTLGGGLYRVSGELGEIEWFTSRWSNSGSTTGRAAWATPAGETVPVIVKAPVGPTELWWTRELARYAATGGSKRCPAPGCTPRVLACGDELGSYDLAWLVIEKVEGRTVAEDLRPDGLAGMIDALGIFQGCAEAVGGPKRSRDPGEVDYAERVEHAREVVRDHEVGHAKRWQSVLRRLSKKLPEVMARWNGRRRDAWCHGDFHPGNAICPVYERVEARAGEQAEGAGAGASRAGSAGAAGIRLLDLALVRRGAWFEDAVFLERLFWGREGRMAGLDPVAALVAARERHGLPSPDPLKSADARRVLMCVTTLGFHVREGDAVYLEAALTRLERLVP